MASVIPGRRVGPRPGPPEVGSWGSSGMAGPPPRLAEVRDLGLLVHGPPHPVADELADDGEPGVLGGALDSRGDVADAVAATRLLDPGLESSLAGLEEALRALGNFADGEGVGRVSH